MFIQMLRIIINILFSNGKIVMKYTMLWIETRKIQQGIGNK